MSPRRILLFISSLRDGGAERVMVTLANHWAESGRSVALVTLSDANHDRYEVSSKVLRIGLGVTTSRDHSPWEKIAVRVRRVREFRRVAQEFGPDLALAAAALEHDGGGQ